MADRLEDWIDGRHLTAAALADAAARYRSDPYESVCFDKFLLPRHVERLRRLFAVEGQFGSWKQLRDPSAEWGLRLVDDAEFAAAPPERRYESESVMTGPHPEHRMGIGYLTHLRFTHFVMGKTLQGFLEAITGIDPNGLEGMQVRISAPGDYVSRHNDALPGRRLALVLYLSPAWTPSDAGRLLQYAPDGQTRAIEPLPNRLVLFRVWRHSLHEVERLSDSAAPRWAYTFWMGR